MPSKPPSRLIAARVPETHTSAYPRLARDIDLPESLPASPRALSEPRRTLGTAAAHRPDIEQPERWDGLS